MKTWAWGLIGYLILGAATSYGFVVQNHQRSTNEYNLCVQGNTSRMAIVAGFNAYTDALVAASAANSKTNPKQLAKQVAAFKAEVKKRLDPLKPRDCGAKP